MDKPTEPRYSDAYERLREWMRDELSKASKELLLYAARLQAYVGDPIQYQNVFYAILPAILPTLYRHQVLARLLGPATTTEAYQVAWIRDEAQRTMMRAVCYRGSNPEEAICEARAWADVVSRMDLDGLR